MASLSRTIRRKMLFAGMNKQQKLIWRTTHGKDTQRVREKLKSYNAEKE